MKSTSSSHPSGPPAQICVTLPSTVLQQLPPGLAAGVWVRTMAWDCGFWTVREISHPERFWRVSVTLLEVE